MGGPNYVVPPGEWRLTSYGIAGGTTGGVGTIVVMRLLAVDPEPEFLVVYSGTPQLLTPGVVNTFPANVLVEEGDVIALWMGSGECGVFTGSDDDLIAVGTIDEPPSEGEVLTPPLFLTGFQVNISATLTSISPPPPPPRAAVCTRTPVLRGDGTFGLFADVLVSQLNTTDETSPYFGARPAIYVEGYGLVCQITDIVTYGGNPANYRDSGTRVDGTGAVAPPGLEAVWVAPYAYWVRAP